jgi:hypothetical protein
MKMCAEYVFFVNVKFLHVALTGMGQDMVGDIDTEKMEQEMSAYISALAAAKENPTDEFLLRVVTEARLRLQSFVL